MSNGVKGHQSRALWNRVKEAAVQSSGSLLEGLSTLALGLWSQADAGTKLSHVRKGREDFVASLVGAAATDIAIDKLAAEGEYTVLEAEFLRELNAEAALRDLNQFQKSAGLLDVVKRNPALAGALLGGSAGAAFGAMNDEKPARGAVRFGVPGAATGAMLGYGSAQLGHEQATKLKAQAQAEAEHAAKMRLLEAQLKATGRRR